MAVSAPFNTTTMVTRAYSPLTLAFEWPKMGRLLFMVGSSSLGTVMNGFFVAAFFVEASLRKVGNVFHACVGLSDLIITSMVMPTCAVVLLSGQWDIESVCSVLHFLTLTSTYCYNLFSMLVGIENFSRILQKPIRCDFFTPSKVGITAVLVFLISVIAAGVGVYMDYDYNYCTRAQYGNFYYKSGTAALLHLIPCLITTFSLLTAYVRVRRRARKHVQYKRSHVFEFDSSVIMLNITAYLFFVLAWAPYLIIVYKFPDTSDAYFYQCVWLGMCRSVISSFLYACFNRNFRRAFAHLFNYCCCKNTLSSSYTSRHRRGMEYRPSTREIRVHIMHQALNVNSPRFYSSTRETQEL